MEHYGLPAAGKPRFMRDVLFKKKMRHVIAIAFVALWIFGLTVVIPFAKGGGFASPADASGLLRLANLSMLIGLVLMFLGWPGWLLDIWSQRFKRTGKVSACFVCAGAVVGTLGAIIVKLN
jgi:hypothetical protein